MPTNNIIYGPPGTGKTTLAHVISSTTSSHFISINAVLAGVADIVDDHPMATRLHTGIDQTGQVDVAEDLEVPATPPLLLAHHFE